MIEFFTGLTSMLYESWWLALASSFVWGLLSIVLSPCHLGTIPLVVGFINDRGNMTKGRAALLSTLFALGILVTLVVIGLVTGLAGRILGDIGGFVNYIVGGLLVLFGVYMLGIIRLPFLEQGVKPAIEKKGALASFVIGLVFGVALGPCAFAFMAPMLGIVFGIASENPAFAAALVLAFAVGHCLVIVLAGTFSEVVRKYLNWNEKSKGAVWVKRVCGMLVIAAGVYLIVTAG